MAETNSLLNCRTGYCTGGSNPPLSAKLMKVVKRSDFFPVFLFYRVRADSVDEGSIGIVDYWGKYRLGIVFQKVCKSQFYYFCIGNFKNELLWNLHMNKFRK